MKYKLPIVGKWMDFDDDYLLKLAQDGKGDDADFLRTLWAEYEQNRLAFFLAHGQQRPFINDYEHELCILWGPNRAGKTFGGEAWMAMRLIPCDPKWECFTPEHGLVCPKWNGPKQAVVASYEMMIHCRTVLWPALAWLLPEHELGAYSPHWQPRDKRSKRKTINWTTFPEITLACGSEIHYMSYKQPPEAFEGTAADLGHYDEQIPLRLFEGAWRGCSTRQGFQACITATPHYIKNRPDTGAAGWVVRMDRGLLKMGINFKSYRLSRDDVPEAIISKERQAADFDRLITQPLLSKNTQRIRAGRSRWYGEPESSEGLVYDWMPSVHLVEPFPIPKHWTRYRAMDPGKKDPFAVLWAAVSPWNDVILYREHYEAGQNPEQNVLQIIQKSGNHRYMTGKMEGMAGQAIPFYEELFDGEQYGFSVMDGRTFASPSDDSSQTVGGMYARLGLRCIPASGKKNEVAVPIVEELFEIHPERTHLLIRLGIKKEILDRLTQKPLKGAPRIYVFTTLRCFQAEIAAYAYQETCQKPVETDDHLMTALKYLVLANPRYCGPQKTEIHHVPDAKTRSYAEKMSQYR